MPRSVAGPKVLLAGCRGPSMQLRYPPASSALLKACSKRVVPCFQDKKTPPFQAKSWNGGVRGAPCRIRTDDPRFTRAVLWPTELRRRAPWGMRPKALDKVSPTPAGRKNAKAGRGIWQGPAPETFRNGPLPVLLVPSPWRRWLPAGSRGTVSARCLPCPTACRPRIRSGYR